MMVLIINSSIPSFYLSALAPGRKAAELYRYLGFLLSYVTGSQT